MLKFEKIKNSYQIIGDFTKETHKIEIKKYFGSKIDLIISDMAVNTIGNKDVDSIVTGELCLEGNEWLLEVLKEQGKYVSKFLWGLVLMKLFIKLKKIEM